jgi:hypothetical protein
MITWDPLSNYVSWDSVVESKMGTKKEGLATNPALNKVPLSLPALEVLGV